MAEVVVLDPTEEATGRDELPLTDFIGKDGPDWGDAAIARALASIPSGDLPVGDPRWPNRQIVMPLGALREMPAQSFQEARTQLEQKVGLIQTEQFGVLKREVDGTPLYAEITGATLKLGGSRAQARGWVDPDASLTLDALPHWLEAEEEHGPFTATGILVYTIANLRGSVPGPIRIVVTNGGSVAWRSLLYALQSRHYDADANAALSFEVESLTALEGATSQADTLAYGGNAIERLNLPTNWVGVAEPATAMKHSGTVRLWARVRDLTTTYVDKVQIRVEYAIGSTVRRVQLPASYVPANSLDFAWLDLGEVTIPELTGGQRWFPRLLARSTDPATGIGVRIDKLLVIPTDEAMGVVLGRSEPAEPTTFTAYDDFGLPSGNLTGRTPKKGTGNWSFITGDADDFSVPAAGGVLQRTAVSDITRRYMRLGTGIAALLGAQVDFMTSALPSAGFSWGVEMLLRFVDINNYLSVQYSGGTLSTSSFAIAVVDAGVVTFRTIVLPVGLVAGARYRMRAVAEADGRVTAWLSGAGIDRMNEMRHAKLVTGQSLDDGGYGLAELWNGAGAATRSFYNFQVFTPDLDAVAYPSKKVEISDRGAFREESAVAIYPELLADGDLPLARPGGMEGRTLRGLIVPSRGRPGETADPTSDESIETTVYTRGAHLFVPEPS